MNRIRVLLWDIDNTLLDFKASEKTAIRKAFESFDLGECSDEMIAEYSAINDRYWQMLEKGIISRKQTQIGRFVEFFNNHQIDTSLAESFNLCFQDHLPDTICFMDDGYEIVRSLKGKVLQCAASNGSSKVQERKLRASGLEQLLDLVFISEELGVEKPGKEFFSHIFSKAELWLKENEMNYQGPLQRKQIMIVGDSLTSDMKGGNNAGIVSCWYNPGKKNNDSDVIVDYEIHDLHEIYEIIQ